MREAVALRRPLLDDFRRHAGGLYFADVFTALAAGPGQEPLAAALRIDPSRRLFRELQRWPLRSQSGEVLLVRREGGELVYLNSPRGRPGEPCTLRLPATTHGLAEARSQEGLCEGRDYQGKAVLSVVRRIEGTSWRLVAKVDLEEALSEARGRSRVWLLATGLSAAAMFLLSILIWRARESLFSRNLQAAQVERNALVGHFAYLHRYANDIILLMDGAGRIVEANDRAVSTYGWSREELLSKTIQELRDPSTMDMFAEHWRKARSPEGVIYETRHVRRDGSVFPVEVSSRSIELEGANYRQSIIRDISGRKQQEAALARTEANLAKAQQIASLGSWEVDLDSDGGRDGGRYWWSAEVYRIFGVDPSAYQPSWENFLACVHPEDRQIVIAASRKALEAGTVYQAEHRVIRPDGQVRYVREQAEVLRGADGSPLKMIGTVHDITEIKRLEEQLAESRRMESIGLLAGGVAHDFNNLLTVINGYSEMVLRSMPDSDPNWRAVREVAKAGERAASLTRQLLAFGRRQVLMPQVFDLNETVREMESLLRRLAGDHISLDLHLNAAPAEVLADPNQVQQVILNLAVNARDALPNGGRIAIETARAAVRESTQRGAEIIEPGEYVALAIRDNGAGMTEDVRSRMFEPFFTTKPLGTGTGLGISMVYGIVRQSQGWTDVETRPGAGTSIVVHLPCARAPRTVGATGAPPPVEMRGSGGRILVVEDHAEVRSLAAEALRRSGYVVIEAGTPGEAEAAFASTGEKIDLLLADVVMPESNGWDLAMRLRDLKPDLAVVLMSGYAENANSEERLAEKRVGFIQKPFHPAELSALVGRVLKSG